jgi:hypothetical protein
MERGILGAVLGLGMRPSLLKLPPGNVGTLLWQLQSDEVGVRIADQLCEFSGQLDELVLDGVVAGPNRVDEVWTMDGNYKIVDRSFVGAGFTVRRYGKDFVPRFSPADPKILILPACTRASIVVNSGRAIRFDINVRGIQEHDYRGMRA